jgi:hypothetical protein
MPAHRTIRRYSAYFRGWAQAFGYHESQTDEPNELEWLSGKDQIGLVMTPRLKRFLNPRFLGKRASAPSVTVADQGVWIDNTWVSVAEANQGVFEAALELLESSRELHLFLTYHLFYPSGTRILTLSRNAPLGIIYKEIEPVSVRLP